MSKYNSKNYKYWSSSISKMSSLSSSDVWWCGEGWGGRGGVKVVEVVHRTKNCHSASAQSSYTWSSSFALWIVSATSTTPYPSCGAHTVPCTHASLLELLLHWFIQCMDLTIDVLCNDHKAWRIWHTVRGPHLINPPLVASAVRLGPYLIIANRWASRSDPFPLLQLLRSGFGQLLGETHVTIRKNKIN